MTMHLLRTTLVTATIALSLGVRDAAAVPVPSFDPSFAAWSGAGDVSEQPGGIFLTTASLDFDDDYPELAGAFNLSGTPAIAVGGGPGTLEDFLGLAGGGLDPDPDNGIFGYEGSGLQQTFAVEAGYVLSFNWQLLTNEGIGADYAFVLLDGTFTSLASAPDATLPSSFFGNETGWSTFTHTFTNSGIATLALGVVDVGDFVTTTALQVDGFAVAIPEPSTYALMGGLLTLGLAAWRRRRA